MATNDLLTASEAQEPGLPTPPDDPLAKKWAGRAGRGRKHWEKLRKRIEHNRKKVAGFCWDKDPATQEFVDPRANLIFATAQATLPNIYARNPDVSVTGTWRNKDVRLFCETLETVLSKQMRMAKLKSRMKMSVLAAMTEYFGIVKMTYQRDIERDPLITQRINDAQDNLVQLDNLIQQSEDPQSRGDAELKKRELEEQLRGLEAQSEVVRSEGLVLDRVLPENLIIDDGVVEFDDYPNADWMIQEVPMARGRAQGLYKVNLSKAKAYKPIAHQMGDGKNGRGTDGGGRLMSGEMQQSGDDDEVICILEIWDRTSQLVYTMADGCNFFCREPYPVEKAGQRWFPFFILPYAVLPGQFVAPCLVDLTEKLQNEYNGTRDKFAAHRELNQPGWIAAADANMKTLKRHTDAILGEVVLIDPDGKPLNQVIQPKQSIPVNPADYDTGPIRVDWEQVTGLQDAARSTVVQPKTATEASIMQQSLSGRTAEFRDKLEDLLQEMDECAAQILLQELSPAQVERYTGQHKMGVAPDPMNPGAMIQVIEEPAYDWPQLSRGQIFDMVEINIVAGTTGAPDKVQAQETWAKIFPLVQQLLGQIMQIAAQGGDYGPLEALLRETLHRFDDRIDVDQFLPRPAPTVPPVAPGAAPAAPAPQAGPVQSDPSQDPMAAVQQGGQVPGAPAQAPTLPALTQ
ncbi:MAG: hypothetical protein J0I68_30870 [Achromobacter sp.]|uniref:hypothetical protein n=1 Tax=unclassified Achromobacter TaxID=2626865 RepID=UPI0006BFFA24|nr:MULTISPECIES: hypothetical protein [unclassified Achromobacter]MBN9642968.1 hypothetical protein [Achromobacter sp.]CUJ80808.1 Uncharacterised protein [Achromobacter sp. 2789STDY5608628]